MTQDRDRDATTQNRDVKKQRIDREQHPSLPISMILGGRLYNVFPNPSSFSVHLVSKCTETVPKLYGDCTYVACTEDSLVGKLSKFSFQVRSNEGKFSPKCDRENRN